jgi:hypothetical protein
MDTIDNICVKLADAEEARKKIDTLFAQYRNLIKSIDVVIEQHELEITKLKAQRERLIKFLPRNIDVNK